MLYAEKGNKVKEINESMIESCVQQGYRIVNGAGVVIRETIPTNPAELRLAYTKHEEKIKALNQQIANYEAKIVSLEAQLAEATSEISTPVEKESKPKRTRKTEKVEAEVTE